MAEEQVSKVFDEAELTVLKSRIQTLDVEGKGITANQLRVFYPKTGWTRIFASLYALEERGEVKRVMHGSPVPFEYFSVV